MMAKQLKKVSRERTCTDCPYLWNDEPNQIKIAMSSGEPRPVKIYFIQLCAQQRHRSDCADARMRILIKTLVVRCSDNLFIGFCMPNSNLRRAAEAVVV